MENQEVKLEDKIITSKYGKEFIFPVHDINTREDIEAKIVEYAEKLRLAEANDDLEEIKKSKRMIELLATQEFSSTPGFCQTYYLKNGLNDPIRSLEEKEEAKAKRAR